MKLALPPTTGTSPMSIPSTINVTLPSASTGRKTSTVALVPAGITEGTTTTTDTSCL